MTDDDAHRVRMITGESAMQLQDAIGDEFVALALEAASSARGLRDHLVAGGLSEFAAQCSVLGMVLGALKDE